MKRFIPLIIALFAILLPGAAFAACTSPAAAAGSFNWNGTAFQYCDGTNWNNFGGGGASWGTVDGGTVTTSTPYIFQQTWNAGAVTFTGIKANFTSTASAAASLLVDLQVGGSSMLQIGKDLGYGLLFSKLTNLGGIITDITHGVADGGFISFQNNVVLGRGGTQSMIVDSGYAAMLNGNYFGFGPNTTGGNTDLFLRRAAAASLQLGNADAAAPVAQTLGVQSVVAGTTNTAGTDFTIAGSKGTGTGAGGALVFKTAPAGSTGTAQNALAEAVRITSAGNVGIGTSTVQLPLMVANYGSVSSDGEYCSGLAYYNAFFGMAAPGNSEAGNSIVMGPGCAGNNPMIRMKTSGSSMGYVGWAGNESYFYIGTGATNAHDFRIITNNTNRISVLGTNGFVGIGTTAPTALLHLSGNRSSVSWTTTGIAHASDAATYTDTNSAAAATIATRAATSLGIPTYASTNAITVTNAANLYIAGAPAAGTNTTITNSNALYVAAGNSYFGGNVGIGTTASAYTLDVNGDIRLGWGKKIYGQAGGNNYVIADINSGNGDAEFGNASYQSHIYGNAIFADASNGYFFNNTGNNGYQFQIGGTTKFIVTQGGNVGIGTTVPGTALDLNGAQTFRGMAAPSVSAAGQGIIYFDSTANVFKVSQNGGAYANLVGGGGGSPGGSTTQIQYNNAGAFAGAAAMTYATSGSLLTVTAQAATDKPLIVKGAASQSANLQEWQNSSGTALGSITSAGGAYFAGNVGIGTATPGTTLEVTSGAANTSGLKLTNLTSATATTASAQGIGVDASGNVVTAPVVVNGGQAGQVIIGSTGTGPVQFNINNARAMYLSQFGNFGIGNSNPAALLAVGGSSQFQVDTVGNVTGTTATLNGGTVTVSTPVINASQTWNAGAVAFTGLKMNITNTASAATSLLMDLQVGGSSVFNVRNTSTVTAIVTNSANNILQFSTNGQSQYSSGNYMQLSTYGYVLSLVDSGNTALQLSGNYNSSPGIMLGSNATISFSNTTYNAISGLDTFIMRGAAANLRLGSVDAAAPVAQTLSVQNVVAGTTNTAGTDFTIAGSQGTGTGAGGAIVFKTAPAGTTGTAQNALATAMTITGAGNVGIGTTTASYPLDITGNVRTTGNIYMGTFGTSGPYIQGYGQYVLAFWAGGTGALGVTNTRIEAATNISYGWSGSPVGGGSLDTGISRPSAGVVSIDTTTAGNAAGTLVAGLVGIGTTAPGTALDVNGAFTQRGMAAPSVSAAGQGRIYFDSTANKFQVSENGGAYANLVSTGGVSGGSAGYAAVWSSASALTYDSSLFIDTTNHRVGIGTTAPGQKLSVAGAIESTVGGFQFPDGTRQATAANGLKAWARINGSTGAIIASSGVSSVTRVSAGKYTVTLSSTQPDANYAVTVSAQTDSSNVNYDAMEANASGFTRTTTQFQLWCVNYTGSAFGDPTSLSFSVYGN